ncbi:MAG: transposase [Bifidobacteriaceae bacterium]|nr:transposase [Bifidobacteriaceae bacterium]
MANGIRETRLRNGGEMSRVARQQSATGIFHVMIRGVNRQVIFERDDDRCRFLGILAHVKGLTGCRIYAYCLMDNHVHLLLREGHEPLALVMKRLTVRYARWFNETYGRVGHLFQGRFRSYPVEDDPYLVTVLRYIWQNPVRAGLCSSAAAYPWSSRHWVGVPNDLVNESDLVDLLSVNSLSELDGEPGAAEPIRIQDPPPLPPGAGDWAKELAEVFERVTGANTVADFQRLPINEQRRVIQELHARRVPLAQLARLTGLSHTQVYWRAKTAVAEAPARE